MTLIFASAGLLIGSAVILLCVGLALRNKGYLNKSEKVGLVTGFVFGAIGVITFLLGNDFVIPFMGRGVIIAAGIGIVLLSVFRLSTIRRQSEIETPRNPVAVQEQRPSLTYGQIHVIRTLEKGHGGKYHYFLYLLEISILHQTLRP